MSLWSGVINQTTAIQKDIINKKKDKMTVLDFIRKNPEFKKYKCGYVLRSNNESINYRTIKNGMMHINLKYYIIDSSTDEVVDSNVTYCDGYSEPVQIIEATEVTLDVKKAKLEIKTLYEIQKSMKQDNYDWQNHTIEEAEKEQEWCNAYNNYIEKLTEYQVLYQNANQNLPNWLRR